MATIPAPSSGSQSALRGLNPAAITAALTSGGPQLQAELARVTGLSRATVSNIVTAEVAAGRYRTEKVLHHCRWGQLISLAPADWVVVGIDIGRTHLRMAGWDTARQAFGEVEVSLESHHRPVDTLRLASELLDGLVADAGLRRTQVRRGGIAVPASIGLDGRVVQQAVLREWSEMDLAGAAAQALRIDVVVDNDANLGALAHAQEGGEGTLVYLKVASGIGAGILVGDRLYHSTSGLVGELGHVPVLDGGQMCYCGSRGCLETLASTRAVVAAYSHVHGVDATTEEVMKALADGDLAALRIVEEAGAALGGVLAVVCTLLSPDTVVIGGTLAQAGPPLVDAITASVRKRALPAVSGATRFVLAGRASRAEMVGACIAALTPPEGSAQARFQP